MDQTDGKLREDVRKKRREYLGKKAGAEVLGAVTAVFALALGALALVLMFAVLMNIGNSGASLFFFAFLTVFIGAVAVYTGRISSSSFEEARTLEYVPSAAEQLAALPAEDILVRGSDRPDAPAEELVRAASPAGVNAANELLRSEAGTQDR